MDATTRLVGATQMTDLGKSYPGAPGTPPHGTPVTGSGQPLSAPTVAPPLPPTMAPTMVPPAAPPMGSSPVPGRHSQRLADKSAPDPEPPAATSGGTGTGGGTAAVVKGRVTIEDEVIQKIAALATLDVPGVAALGGQAVPNGVRVHLQDNEVAADLAVVVEYGSVIMEVAKVIKSNVARVVSLMLGMRVTAVNVIVEDVRPPAERTVPPR